MKKFVLVVFLSTAFFANLSLANTFNLQEAKAAYLSQDDRALPFFLRLFYSLGITWKTDAR
ncbi:hypothetical protein OQH60_05065 [Campylobacter sp. MIT 21-1685]|uniref:hypothetical protein n=1 Tax=unclassified Campylobacter TaxID=2593542 RepID=UPI00224A5079|nr:MULTISPECIES: hypothetical protein [unclassified Campylobacter]MCX2683291.1 hypothetical protein [Campylobacter sp. MIT 21-1684]MCX2751516.1 hypothetical protein [Campylobacter sp. MIT 21-1682]MCX2807715.1 hypothetical protein [Campylobacter sp. MIT 21-1685]